MPYYYSTTSQLVSNGTANQDLLLANWLTTAAGQRAVIQKIQAGSFVSPADNGIRLRLHRVLNANLTPGSAYTPPAAIADAPAANVTVTTLPTIGGGALSTNPLVQLAFNQRGTAIWAALNPDEGIGIVGSGVPNNELVLDSQATFASVPINFDVKHSE